MQSSISNLYLSVVFLALVAFPVCDAIKFPTPTPFSLFANAEPTHEAKPPRACAKKSNTCQSQQPQQPQQQQQQQQETSPIFGIARRMPALLKMRGGSVLEPASLDEVESILLRSGAEQKLVIIDFTATWCGPCKMIAPLFNELSDKFKDVVFLKVDVDENPDTAAKFNVSAMPTFVFIKAGEVIDRLMGANPGRLEDLIEEHK